MSPLGLTPEQPARQTIDANPRASGWQVQDRDEANLHAGRGVAVREFKLEKGHGAADYLLFVDGRTVGALEVKKAGEPLRAHERQAERYSEGLPVTLTAPVKRLPLLYLSNGTETLFANLLDPDTRRASASDELRTVASSVSATLLASLARSARTRQSILKWAFEGHLSDQHRGTIPAPTAVDNPATIRRSAST